MSPRKPADSPTLFEIPPGGPDFALEHQAQKNGFRLVAGCDEAGRGPLAGPVVAAAVILDPAHVPAGLNDSKKLTAKKREALYAEIMAHATVGIASSGPELIDRINILRASLDAMRRAVEALARAPDMVLTDGRDTPPNIAMKASAVIKGDARSLSIAAASIVAKVTRDRMMDQAAHIFPAYGFEKHAGYGTAAHLAAIRQHGPCPLHRMSFRPLKQD
ncbi:ribonuclease HII [Martelella alba]|uniref:Ribonuclease HII n=1 Tax=Martelella alba TaxID=2590451 RepID=A0A506UGE7_9HYPH|nr:ribonuclease HII [Martelella alba]TPW32395.1 ribonuclease HII [Martelella alba]